MTADTVLTQLFIGTLRPLPPEGQLTGIYKLPINNTIQINELGLIGDYQADKRVHGGAEKAIHHYAAENYAQLAAQYPHEAQQFVAGSLGENLSSIGLHEHNVCIGDIYQLGDCTLQVSQPRSPCWKINHKFGIEKLSLFIQEHNITGWYYRVLQAGKLNQGDSFKRISCPNPHLTIAYFWQNVLEHRPEISQLEAIAHAEGLSPQWQKRLTDRIAWLRQHP
ncbi:hypothetical protein BegalDRAFT_0141 [Beggiatoa alba B18LD]|uniref:MOSC domain-containing protein n=1 Tax=Beggiatoa alba B18LD TaxID=395493 RepID=I3CBS1_9GAMM|nr:MOSC domain-containing protein [Beggiatoa alba]EIJ41064.1 hypothetical protein BegalDRAFT_0141 [Beggiatoa alba B18LD]